MKFRFTDHYYCLTASGTQRIFTEGEVYDLPCELVEEKIPVCSKCHGSGYVRWNQLEEYHGPAIETGEDDTNYNCDLCEGTVKEKDNDSHKLNMDTANKIAESVDQTGRPLDLAPRIFTALQIAQKRREILGKLHSKETPSAKYAELMPLLEEIINWIYEHDPDCGSQPGTELDKLKG